MSCQQLNAEGSFLSNYFYNLYCIIPVVPEPEETVVESDEEEEVVVPEPTDTEIINVEPSDNENEEEVVD